MRFLPLFTLLLLSCATGERTLTDSERERLGLNGRIYDARICPGNYNASSKDLAFPKPCEIVNCEPVNKKIVCKAKPEPKNSRY